MDQPSVFRSPQWSKRERSGQPGCQKPMKREPQLLSNSTSAESVLQVYMLGLVEFEAALALQRRLVYQVTGDPNTAALILCEHPPLITVGREGSWSHLHCDPGELQIRRWRIRWVNRGGGCLLHL